MKAIITTAELQYALGIVGKVVPPRCIKPVLQCIKMDAQVHKIIITGTDLECRAAVTVQACEVEQPGVCLIDAGRLSSIMRLANAETVAIESADDFTSTVKLDGRQYHLLGYDPAEYPAAPVDECEGSITLTAEQVKRISAIVPMAAKSASHYAMSAVLLDGKTVVTTDGHRLAAITLGVSTEDARAWGSVLVPPRMMALISSAIDETVVLSKTGNTILADTGSATFSASRVQGNFPKYADVIPKANVRWTADRAAMVEAVNAAAVMTSEDSRGVKVAIADNMATLTARQAERGDAEVTMPIDGEDFTTAFNPAFVVEGLNAITTEQIQWSQSGPLKPAMFAGGDCRIVVMPIEVAP